MSVGVSCVNDPPPTPPPMALDYGTDGSLVRMGQMEAYLARPEKQQRERCAELWIGDPRSHLIQSKARQRAVHGCRVLVASTTSSTEEVRYLEAMEPSMSISLTCTVQCRSEADCRCTPD